MRERPNSTFRQDDSSSELRNDLYRSLEPTFEHLLQSDDPGRFTLNGDGYVNHPEMEEVLISFCAGDTNQCAYLVGSTGIGKSTLLRHTLLINRSAFVGNGTLYIPCSLNQRYIKDEIDLRQQLGSVLQDAVWVAKGNDESFYTEKDKRNIADLLLITSPDLADRPELGTDKPKPSRALDFVSNPSFAYQTAQIALKHFTTLNDSIKRVVLILDDLEGAKDPKIQEEAIAIFLQTFQCLLNVAPNARRIPIRVLVGVRPETHAWLSKQKHNITVPFRSLAYTKPVSLADIFRKRFEVAFNREDYKHLRNRDRLDTAIRVLNAIGDTLAGRFSTRLVELCNNDLRTTLEHFRRVTCNRRWLQRDKEWEPFFKIDEHGFALSQASVIRALGMGEGEVYPQARTCIANILWNRREESSDFLLLYAIKYLVHRSGHIATRENIYSIFERLLGSGFDQEMLADAVEYGVDNGLLHVEKSPGSEKLVLTPRAFQTYEMLGETSLAFGLFHDDIHQTFTRSGTPRKPLMHLRGAEEGFSRQALLVGELWDAESKLRDTFRMNGAPEAGSAYFGTTFESARMRQAVKNSADAFFHVQSAPGKALPDAVALALRALDMKQIPTDLKDGAVLVSDA